MVLVVEIYRHRDKRDLCRFVSIYIYIYLKLY